MRPVVTDGVAWSVDWSVCQSVTLVSPAKTAEPIEMPLGLRSRVGPGNHVLDGSPDLPMPMRRGKFWGENGRPIVKFRHTLRSGHLCKDGWTARDGSWVVGSDSPKESWVRWGSRSPYGMGKFLGKEETVVKYRNFLPWAVHKRLNRSACRFGCGLGWAEGITSSVIFVRWRQCALVGATWRIRLNRLATAAMRPYVKLLWPLVLGVKVNCSSFVFNIIKSIWILRNIKNKAILEKKSASKCPLDDLFTFASDYC